MKKYYYSIIIFLSAFILLSNSSQHPTNPNGGFTGAPLDGVCLECHTNQNNNLSGSYVIEGIPEVAFIGESYPLNIMVTNPEGEASRAGFQLVALERDLTNAGELSAEGSNILVKNAKGRTYIGHSPAVEFNSKRIAAWLASWSPTESDTGMITFYGAAMIGNGSDGNRRDRAIFRQWATSVKSPEEGIDVQISVVNELMCYDSNNGKLTLITYGGIEPFSYSWNVGTNTEDLDSIGPGTYTVTITDALGNKDSDTIEIQPLDSLIIENSEINQPSSQSNSDGRISLEIVGGTAPYTIDWISIPSGESIGDSLVLENVGVGDYQAVIIDANNCTISSEIFQLSFNTSTNLIEKTFTVFPNPTSGIIYLNSEITMSNYRLMTLTGQILSEGTLDYNQKIDLSNIQRRGLFILITEDTLNLEYGTKIIIN